MDMWPCQSPQSSAQRTVNEPVLPCGDEGDVVDAGDGVGLDAELDTPRTSA